MKIVVIHQYFLRPEEGGASRFNEMTSRWAEAGHEVTVIAGQAHYASGEKAPEYRRKLMVEEWYGAVRVLRTYTPSTFHASIPGRMWAFAGFATAATAVVLTAIRDADVVVATSPSLLVLVPGLAAKVVRRWPLVFEVRDLWPESAVATGVLGANSPITRGLYRLEALGYRLADRINVLTPAFRENILDRRLANDDDIVFIPNGADLDLVRPGPVDVELRERLGWGDKFVMLYAGAHGIANHLWQYIDAAEALRDDENILLASVGDGPQREDLIAETERRGLKNLQWLDAVPKSEMVALLRSADAGAAVLKRTDTFKTVYPNKIFDYMSCELPVLCVIDGVARQLVEAARAGVFAEPENPQALARAIRSLAKLPPAERKLMGRRGRTYVAKNFDRTALADSYLQVLSELVEGEAPQGPLTETADEPAKVSG